MQVEYAMEAINNAGSTVGVLCPEGIVIGAERKQTSKLLERSKYSEKMYQIDSHIVCAAAGLTADANILINYARTICQDYQFSYHQQIPVEQLVRQLCNAKQGYTQRGGLRPFGVSFLYAGWDSITARNCTARTPAATTSGGRPSPSAPITSPPAEYSSRITTRTAHSGRPWASSPRSSASQWTPPRLLLIKVRDI